MRFLKLSLLLIACCTLAQAQTASTPNDAAISVPPHSTSQLFERVDHARSLAFLSAAVERAKEAAVERSKGLMARKPSKVDPGIQLNARSTVDASTCFKLRKYIFQPNDQTEKNGMRPLGDEMQFVGETDCTYANKVWPKSADGANPPRPQFGVQSAVAHQK